MKKQFNAHRADLRAAAWQRRNAALFTDDLAGQLGASLAHIRLSVDVGPLDVIELENRAIERDDSIARIIARKLRDGDDYASIEMERDQAKGERRDAREQLAREKPVRK